MSMIGPFEVIGIYDDDRDSIYMSIRLFDTRYPNERFKLKNKHMFEHQYIFGIPRNIKAHIEEEWNYMSPITTYHLFENWFKEWNESIGTLQPRSIIYNAKYEEIFTKDIRDWAEEVICNILDDEEAISNGGHDEKFYLDYLDYYQWKIVGRLERIRRIEEEGCFDCVGKSDGYLCVACYI